MLAGDIDGLVGIHQRMALGGSGFYTQGFVVMLLAGLVIAIRCSGTVTGERERSTWEALLLTPLETHQLIRGKLWGIIGASIPYLTAYALPALAFALIGGMAAFFWVVLWTAVTLLAMFFVGAGRPMVFRAGQDLLAQLAEHPGHYLRRRVRPVLRYIAHHVYRGPVAVHCGVGCAELPRHQRRRFVRRFLQLVLRGDVRDAGGGFRPDGLAICGGCGIPCRRAGTDQALA